MAKITTVTNPLTGQPAQVDQLDHTAQQIDDAIARALPGGAIDTALQNKAPAGYGLGSVYGLDITGSTGDANNAKYNGWYTTDESTANLPTKFPYNTCKEGTILTAVRGAQVKQIFFDNNYGYIATRLGNADTSVWGEWEYVNPPMQLGVEYRTTERYQGKPVYVKVVDFGSMPNATTKTISHGIANIAYPISAYGCTKDGWSSIPSVGIEGLAGVMAVASLTNTQIRVWCKDDWTANECYIAIKYTKTTD